MAEIRTLFARYMGSNQPSDVLDSWGSRIPSAQSKQAHHEVSLDPWGSRIPSAPSSQAQCEAQREAERADFQRVFSKYMSSILPLDVSDQYDWIQHKGSNYVCPTPSVHQEQGGGSSLSPTGQEAQPVQIEERPKFDGVVMHGEKLEQIETKGDLIIAREHQNPDAHKVLDEMPSWTNSKGITFLEDFPRKTDESIQMEGFLAGNFPIHLATLLTNDLENVNVMMGEWDNMVSFDPGGELITLENEVVRHLRVLDELNRGNTLSIPTAKRCTENFVPEMMPKGAINGFSSKISETIVNRKYAVCGYLFDKNDELAAYEGEIFVVMDTVHESGMQISAMVSKDHQFKVYSTLIAHQAFEEISDDIVGISLFDPGGKYLMVARYVLLEVSHPLERLILHIPVDGDIKQYGITFALKNWTEYPSCERIHTPMKHALRITKTSYEKFAFDPGGVTVTMISLAVKSVIFCAAFLLILEDKDPSRREYCDRAADIEKVTMDRVFMSTLEKKMIRCDCAKLRVAVGNIMWAYYTLLAYTSWQGICMVVGIDKAIESVARLLESSQDGVDHVELLMLVQGESLLVSKPFLLPVFAAGFIFPYLFANLKGDGDYVAAHTAVCIGIWSFDPGGEGFMVENHEIYLLDESRDFHAYMTQFVAAGMQEVWVLCGFNSGQLKIRWDVIAKAHVYVNMLAFALEEQRVPSHNDNCLKILMSYFVQMNQGAHVHNDSYMVTLVGDENRTEFRPLTIEGVLHSVDESTMIYVFDLGGNHTMVTAKSLINAAVVSLDH